MNVLFLTAVMAVGPLPKMNITSNSVSVSGVSSGGAMAVQMHVAFSSKVIGGGMIATPPFYCAMDALTEGLTACMSSPQLMNVALLQREAEAMESKGGIDPLSNLNNTRLYIETGKYDTVVMQGVVNKTAQWYSKYVAPSNQKETAYLHAEHCWPTDSYGNKCLYLGEPYINNCGFDAAGTLLQHIYGNLKPRVTPNSQNLVMFDQTLYGADKKISMSDEGVLYVPVACKASQCKLHVCFHGCEQTVKNIGDKFYTNTGLNNWAEANNIVVLYPQAVPSEFMPQNPKGCWDWWGYTNRNYAEKTGPQMVVIQKMIEALGGW
eukprot:TRINITY_DN2934_c0_g1_i3.p1 TRINITY_DN2934_c0_g1~~TRINITY_DN2934_c0_g1_i3.p1  ORF type:complete len:340 (+),score=71.51 TRINITY_DN2934_c0_g1_i3:60-1022(+)